MDEYINRYKKITRDERGRILPNTVNVIDPSKLIELTAYNNRGGAGFPKAKEVEPIP